MKQIKDLEIYFLITSYRITTRFEKFYDHFRIRSDRKIVAESTLICVKGSKTMQDFNEDDGEVTWYLKYSQCSILLFVQNFVRRVINISTKNINFIWESNLKTATLKESAQITSPFWFKYQLTNSMAYGTWRFNSLFTRALQ